MFFIEKGEVAVGVRINEKDETFYIHKKNTFTGGFFIIYKKPCFASYIIETFAQGFAIPGKVLNKVGKLFPSQYELIKKICLKKAAIIIRRMIERYSQFIDLSYIENYQKEIDLIRLNISNLDKVEDPESMIHKAEKLKLLNKPVNVLKDFKNNLKHLVREVNKKQKVLIDMTKH